MLPQTQKHLTEEIDSPCNGVIDFALTLRSEPALCIGSIGIFSRTRAEVGFLLGRKHWRRGYMLEAMNAWLEYLWSDECIATMDQVRRDGLAEMRERKEVVEVEEQQPRNWKDANLTFVGEGYEEFRVKKVLADVDPRNEACLSLLRKVGFVEFGRRENTFETHLGWCDSIDLELARPMGD